MHKVHCDRGHVVDRNEFQDLISEFNPKLKAYVKELERTQQRLRTNPDGDIAVKGLDYSQFIVPDCPTCAVEGRKNDVHKPAVVFFGETIPTEVKNRSFVDVERADRLFIVGTTLATYSAFR